jgi:hypothetical protein
MEPRKESSEAGQDASATTVFALNPEPPASSPFGYLVDLAKHPETLRLLFECEPAPAYDLPYLYSDDRESAYHGPLLIEPLGYECRDWLNAWSRQGKALAIYGTRLTSQITRQHLTSLNSVQTPHGNSLLRYADPATFASVGPSLDQAQRLRILGPCSAIRGHHMGQDWCLGADKPQDNTDEYSQESLRFTQENLAFIARYRLDLLANALAESNNLKPDLVSDWFRQLEALGTPSEQDLVEGSELLISRGLTRPLNNRETLQIRQAGNYWSDKLDSIAHMEHQEGT